MSELSCKGCGGPLGASRTGQTMILPTTTITSDDRGRVIEERTSDDGWCGDCVDDWNQRMIEEDE